MSSPDKTLEPITALIEPDSLESDGLVLYVACRDRPAQRIPLPLDGTVTIGRANDQRVRVDDATVSRAHATLMLGDGPTVVVNHSRNGTRVGGRVLGQGDSTTLYVGQTIEIGKAGRGAPAAAMWIGRDSASSEPFRVLDHGEFIDRLGKACDRAHEAERFAVLRLRCDGVSDDVVREALAVESAPVDIAGAYAPPHEYELIIAGAGPTQARSRADRLSRLLAGYDAEVRIGFACFPSDGRDAGSLLAQASAALRLDEGSGSLVLPVGALADVEKRLRQLAASPFVPVLLLGETGVGKKIFARRLHELSPRAKGPFVTVNVSSLPETLLENELFGHAKGAFTGANQSADGILVRANGGTVFLDEIGELPLHLQTKLLNVLEEDEVRPIGASRPARIDVRFVSATNRDLAADVRAGRFRDDLYYRIAAARVQIPPLRERRDEIERLSRFFIAEACRQDPGRRPPRISVAALEALYGRRWAGNVRELRNVMWSAVYLCRDDEIRPEDLEPELPARAMEAPAIAVPATSTQDAGPGAPENVATPAFPGAEPAAGAAGAARDLSAATGDDPALWNHVTRMKQERILWAMKECGDNQSMAAERLDISRGTLSKLLKEMGYFTKPRRQRRRPE